MKKTSDSTIGKKSLSWLIKNFVRATFLTGGLLLSQPVTQASESPKPQDSIRDRVELVRKALKQKVASNQISPNSLSFSEKELTQWGNWGNWGNWANWNNWNNWRNWANWGNWGNI